MLKNVKELTGFAVNATDGALGTLEKLYFDDSTWTIRYITAATEKGFSPRRVLIPVEAFKQPRWERREFNLNLSREKIRRSPEMDIDRPITPDYRMKLSDYYEFPVYPPPSHEIPKPGDLSSKAMQTAVIEDEMMERQLLSVDEVAGYRARASDGPIGKVSDIVADDVEWFVRYVSIALDGVPAGNEILVGPDLVTGIYPERRELAIGVLKQHVRPNASYNGIYEGVRDEEDEVPYGGKVPTKRGRKIYGGKTQG